MAEIKLTENASSPSAPSAGQISLYAKTDGNLYSKNPANVETLVTAGAAITALTGDVVASGPGSAVATIQPNTVTAAKLAQTGPYTIIGNGTGVTANVQDLTRLILGAPAFVDTGVVAQITGNDPGYVQEVIQNINPGASSSADMVVANDLGTATSNYGDFGINSSNFSGASIFSKPNGVYLYSASGDLSIGSTGAYKIYIGTNNATTAAIEINASNNLVTPALTGYLKGAGASPVSAVTTIPVADGGTNSTTALSNNRIMKSSGGAIVEAAAITASRALASDANGIPVAVATTATELGYVNGVTSAIQTQINSKVSGTPSNLTTTTPGLVVTGGSNATLAPATINYNPFEAVAQEFLFKDDFITFLVGGQVWNSWTGGGTATVVAALAADMVAGHPGMVTFNTGTTSGVGRAGIGLSASASTMGNGVVMNSETYYEEWLINLRQLSNATDEFHVEVGLHRSSTATTQTNGLTFKYDRATYGANWQVENSSASSTTRTDTGVAVATGWHKFKIVATSSSVEYYIDGALVATQTTNIPSVNIVTGAKISKSAGTTNTIMDVDYVTIFKRFSSPR